MSKKSKKRTRKTKFEIGTLKHALRTEMSQVIYWTLILSVAVIAGIQIYLLNKMIVTGL